MSDFWYSIEEDLEETRKCLKETEQELQRKDNNWNELKKYVKEVQNGFPYDEFINKNKLLDKIKEIESK